MSLVDIIGEPCGWQLWRPKASPGNAVKILNVISIIGEPRRVVLFSAPSGCGDIFGMWLEDFTAAYERAPKFPEPKAEAPEEPTQ